MGTKDGETGNKHHTQKTYQVYDLQNIDRHKLPTDGGVSARTRNGALSLLGFVVNAQINVRSNEQIEYAPRPPTPLAILHHTTTQYIVLAGCGYLVWRNVCAAA